MKVVQVIDSLQVGGAEKVVVLLCNVLAKNGHDVTLVVLTDEVPLIVELDNGVKVKLLKRKFKFNIIKLFQLNRFLRNFDLIHVHLFYNLKYLWVSGVFLNTDKRIIYHDHNGDIHIQKEYSWLKKYIIAKCYLVSVSNEITDWATQVLRLNPSKVYTLPNTIHPQEVGIESYCEVPGLLRLLLVSNFRPTKNIEFALELVHHLKKNQNLRFDIVGNINDSIYRQVIEKKIEELKIQDVVSIWTGITNVQSHLVHYDVALHTAKSESGPLVLIEYLSQGLPFLTYRTGEVCVQLENCLDEFLVDGFFIEDWLTRLNEILKQGRLAYKERMKKCFDEKFSEEKFYNDCIQIYNSISCK